MASRKGRPNKLSNSVKENLTAVFTRLGGTAAMADWAAENQTEFYKLYAKMLPRNIQAEVKHSMVDDLTERLMAAKERTDAQRSRVEH